MSALVAKYCPLELTNFTSTHNTPDKESHTDKSNGNMGIQFFLLPQRRGQPILVNENNKACQVSTIWKL